MSSPSPRTLQELPAKFYTNMWTVHYRRILGQLNFLEKSTRMDLRMQCINCKICDRSQDEPQVSHVEDWSIHNKNTKQRNDPDTKYRSGGIMVRCWLLRELEPRMIACWQVDGKVKNWLHCILCQMSHHMVIKAVNWDSAQQNWVEVYSIKWRVVNHNPHNELDWWNGQRGDKTTQW